MLSARSAACAQAILVMKAVRNMGEKEVAVTLAINKICRRLNIRAIDPKSRPAKLRPTKRRSAKGHTYFRAYLPDDLPENPEPE